MDERIRCPWTLSNPINVPYHDAEWGVPLRDARALFELLILEGAQAGLSWTTILAKRGNYRKAFDGFDPARIARYSPAKVERLMQDAGIVRNRLKIESTIGNARAYLDLQQRGVAFDEFLWGFVDGKPVRNAWRRSEQVPVSTPVSDRLSKALKRSGFRFVGTTIMYAFMQASGMVNDHLVTCFRHSEIERMT